MADAYTFPGAAAKNPLHGENGTAAYPQATLSASSPWKWKASR